MPYRPITPNEIPIVADIQSRAFRLAAERYLEAYNGSGRVDHSALRLLENDAGQPVAALNVFTRPVSLLGGEAAATGRHRTIRHQSVSATGFRI